jgi:hypothetical protein
MNYLIMGSIVFLLWGAPINSEELNKEGGVTPSVTISYTQFSDKINFIKNALLEGRLSSAIYFTQILEKKLINQRQQELDALFPDQVDLFSAEPYNTREQNSGLNEASFGVILSKRYSNNEGHYIEILLVNDNDAIREYGMLIKNPTLIAGIKDARIIQLRHYKAIEKWLPDQNIVEQNIIINSHLMMNIFSKGVASPETVEAFLDKIPFKKIEAHLKN